MSTRSGFDVLRRGFDNTIANWPIILLRLGEVVLLGLIAVATAVAIILPILVSVGISIQNIHDPADVFDAFNALAGKWMLLLWILTAVTLMLAVFVAVHAFVEAGRARVTVNGDRKAGPGTGPRSRFAAFSAAEWFAGGAAGWWPVFWIYNVTWGLAGLILMIPILPTFLFVLLLRGRPGAAVTAGCFGLALTALLAVVVGFITGIWTIRATAEWALGGRSAREAISGAWRALRGDLGRHLLVAIVMFVVSGAGSAVFASFSFMAGFGEAFDRHGGLSFAFMPLRLAGSILSSILSAAVGTWSLASYSALAVERAAPEEHGL